MDSHSYIAKFISLHAHNTENIIQVASFMGGIMGCLYYITMLN